MDNDDQFTEANVLGSVSTTPITTNGTINPDIDVDMYRITVTAGQVVDFDIDTTLNGAGGLNSYLRVFNSTGQQLAFNDNASAIGEGSPSFDAYLRVNLQPGGDVLCRCIELQQHGYDGSTGNGDGAGACTPLVITH